MKTDHIKMLCDIGELNHLFTDTINLDSFLQCIVDMVAKHKMADVSSIYLYDESEEKLILKATKGLNSELVNSLSLKSGEGLVGLAIKELKPVHENSARNNPGFKYIPDLQEDDYESFLAVPILRGNLRIGVLVVQREKNNFFTKKDVMAMEATASQLASMIEHIKILMLMQGEKKEPQVSYEAIKDLKFIRGKSASSGVAFSPAVTIDNSENFDLTLNEVIGMDLTIDDFNSALKETEEHLEELQKIVEEKLLDAPSLIFASHLLILKDAAFTGRMKELIQAGENPVHAVVEVYYKFKKIFSESPVPLIREKVNDIKDLTARIIDSLLGRDNEAVKYRDHIIVAGELFPSDLLKMSAEGVSGIILVSGGVTSHLSILARSLQIPLIIADNPLLLRLPHDTEILMDAETGNVYIDPSGDIITKFNESKLARNKIYENRELFLKPPVSKDGVSIKILANINLLNDVKIAGDAVEGVGLYRTEFPFMIRNDFPTEEEQYHIYRKLIEGMKGRPVTFRTLDIGGDKVLPYYSNIKEQNPFLGMRSLRFTLTHLEIFRAQIRAILRAGYDTEINIMFPMISSLDDLIESKRIVRECINDLGSEGIKHNSDPGLGIMVELPSIIHIIDPLADESDFFSIGTNDLVQYTLAVDRTNEKVAHLNIPHHPAILKSLEIIVNAGKGKGIDVSICGDMAKDEKYIPFLLGIGIRTFSVDPVFIPKIKNTISQISVKGSESYAKKLLSKNRISEIESIIYSED